MGILLELAARARAAVKLSRGRCRECRVILRDDNTTGTCSDACATEWLLTIHA